MPSECSKFIVSGIVQGVGFRYHTAEQGLKLGLTGYAKNLLEGDVEVLVCGAKDQRLAMEKWLAQGPRTAKVDNVREEPTECREYKGFEIL